MGNTEFSRIEQKELLKVLYKFHDRTVQYLTSEEQEKYHTNSKVITRKKLCSLKYYLRHDLDLKGYIKSISGYNKTMAAVIDIDAHHDEADLHNRYNKIISVLKETGMKYLSAYSSFNNGRPRGIHIYLLFEQAQKASLVRNTLNYMINDLEIEHIDIFPMDKAVRPFWVDKKDGTTPGHILEYNFKGGIQACISSSVSPIINYNKVNLSNTTPGGEKKYTKKRGDDRWKNFIKTLDKGKTLAELWDICKQHAVENNLTHFPFSKGMIAEYYGIKLSTAMSRIATFRKANGLNPDIKSRNQHTAHLYLSGFKADARVDTFTGFSAGKRNFQLLRLIRLLCWRNKSDAEILRISMELFDSTYDGVTDRTEHYQHTRRATHHWRRRSFELVT